MFGISKKCSDRRKSDKRKKKIWNNHPECPKLLSFGPFNPNMFPGLGGGGGGFILMLLTPNALIMCNIMLRLKTENRNISYLILIQIYQQLGST